MSGFSASWLGLREAADHAARSATLTAEIARYLITAAGETSDTRPLRVLDLGTGTGSNPRYLFQYLPSPQDWALLDADPQLLTEMPTRLAAWATRAGWAYVQARDGVRVTTAAASLRVRALHADISRFPIAAFAETPSLITASALLDLVSESWLTELVAACREVNAAALFVLTYDGRTTMSPAHPTDGVVLDLVNRHQRGEKGFGMALGPDAASTAVTLFERAGYDVRCQSSDWTLGPSERTLQAELIAGWAGAACEVQPEATEQIREWERDRLAEAAAGNLVIMVGHQDLAAWPGGSRR